MTRVAHRSPNMPSYNWWLKLFGKQLGHVTMLQPAALQLVINNCHVHSLLPFHLPTMLLPGRKSTTLTAAPFHIEAMCSAVTCNSVSSPM